MSKPVLLATDPLIELLKTDKDDGVREITAWALVHIRKRKSIWTL